MGGIDLGHGMEFRVCILGVAGLHVSLGLMIPEHDWGMHRSYEVMSNAFRLGGMAGLQSLILDS